MFDSPRLGPPGTSRAEMLKIGYLMIVISFVGIFPAIMALILAYADDGGTALAASHRRFQIRTVWLGLVMMVPAGLMSIALVLLGLYAVPFMLVYAWVCVRAIRGWRYLKEGKTHPDPGTFGFG